MLSDYAALDTAPDPEEVRDCERSTRARISRPEEREKRLKFHQSVRDLVVGSGEIVRLPFLDVFFYSFTSSCFSPTV